MAEETITTPTLDRVAIERWEGEGGRTVERDVILAVPFGDRWRSIFAEDARHQTKSSPANPAKSLPSR